jgi:hypothetical protein
MEVVHLKAAVGRSDLEFLRVSAFSDDSIA